MKVVADADVLIKLTKAGLKDVIVQNLKIFTPPKVIDEAIHTGKAEGYPDAFILDENLKKGRLKIIDVVENDSILELIQKCNIKGGEADVVISYKAGEFDAVASDDARFLKFVEALDIPYQTPSSLLVYLFWKRKITKQEAIAGMERLKDYVSFEEYYLALQAIKDHG